MRNALLTLGLALTTITPAFAAAPTAPAKAKISGDYVEARTASVFAGACHYNGELTTTGKEAVLVWHITKGVTASTDLSGLTAMASVLSEANLKDESASRKSILYIDSKATPEQSQAFAALLKSRYAKSLGEIVSVKSAPISYTKKGENFTVSAKGAGALTVEAMPNHECCKQPNMVWYTPLVPLTNRRVGYTKVSRVDDTTLGASWSKDAQNTAFYGKFAL